MSVVRIIRPGPFSTVQDLGRPGFAHLGVPSSGAADTLSLRLGNRLLGNPDAAAAIESTLSGLHASFYSDTAICLTGATTDDALLLDAEGKAIRRITHAAPIPVSAGQCVRVGAFSRGVRQYLCIAGGVRTTPVLGSRSTHAASGIGGHEGRTLRAGDALPLGEPEGAGPRSIDSGARDRIEQLLGPGELRILPGPHAELFGDAAHAELLHASFTIGRASDRVGVRLDGPRVPTRDRGELPTEAMLVGAIQVTPDGTPIVLMADGPTTGGYPVIGVVIASDLPALAQRRPGEAVRFRAVSFDEAVGLVRAQRDLLDTLLPTAGRRSSRP